MADGNEKKAIWVFGDYRNYFKNRVTLQLIARSVALAPRIPAEVCAVVFGRDVREYVGEYIAHGADKVYVTEHPSLAQYRMETYVALMERLIRDRRPEIVLVGATTFGREFAPRVAKRLGTGLTADCVGLDLTEEGLLLQIAPSFGGNLLAEIVTPVRRPQMATVRPGTFQEIPHDNGRTGEVVSVPFPPDIPEDRVRLIRSERWSQRGQKIETAQIVICGGRGMGSKQKFARLYELAKLLGAEVGATRPVVYAEWAERDALVGQAGRNVRPQILLSFGVSGAIQHTAALANAKFIIAVNKNPEAAMMKLADVAIAADANQICSALISELKRRIRI